MDKKDEKTKKAGDEKQAENAQDNKANDQDDKKDEEVLEVVEKFGDPDYASIAPEGEFDLYNVSIHFNQSIRSCNAVENYCSLLFFVRNTNGLCGNISSTRRATKQCSNG